MQAQDPCNISSADDLSERHARELSAFRLLTGPEQARQQIRMRAFYAHNPWEFLRDCVLTLDQVNAASPIKPFPSWLDYTRFLAKVWQREKLLAVPKSRRMICSWTFISLFAHDTFFNPGRFNALVSKKEDDSADLVSRAEFIFHKIPEWRIPRALLPTLKNGKMSKQPPLMEFEEIHSKLQGFPQGSDQMRQYTFSGMLFDEWAFWEEAQAAYSAAKPTLDGGGRLTGISSRSPGFFKKIVFDRLDEDTLTFREQPPVEPKSPLEGVECWRNPLNKFYVVDLHYTADPRKRGAAWREAVRTTMPRRDFEMEYERSWSTFEGKAVYADFIRTLHVSKPVLKPEPGVPLLLGFDFGLTPACLLAQFAGRQLRIFREFLEDSGSISKLAPVVMRYLMLHYPAWFIGDDQIYSYIDPAGFQKAQTDESTCAGILRECGFRQIRPGPVNWEPRRKAVEDFLTKTYSEGPGLLIDEAGCPILIEGFAGGYRYAEKAAEIEPTLIRPVKNRYSHPHDALQYLASGTTALRRGHGLPIPTPNYNFSSNASAEPTHKEALWPNQPPAK